MAVRPTDWFFLETNSRTQRPRTKMIRTMVSKSFARAGSPAWAWEGW